MWRALTRRLGPCFILAVSLPLAAAQKSVVIPLLPAPAWTHESTSAIPLSQLSAYGDNAAMDAEVGVTTASRRIYRGRNGQVAVIFEQAADPSSAYALFTLYQTRRMTPVPGVDLAVSGPLYALMTRGRYFIRVLIPASGALNENEVKSLLMTIGGARISAENMDALPSPLPSRGLVPGSERYMLGPAGSAFAFPSIPAKLIGFTDGVEAKAGTYLRRGERLVLFEISYPTPQLAQSRFPGLASALRLNQASGPGAVYGHLDGSYIVLVLNAKTHAAATEFLSRFKIREIVSSVPTHPDKGNFVLQMVQLVIANGVLVGIILVLAILGGLVIYGTKRLIMKLFPNSGIIKRDDEILIKLRLG